MSEAECIDAETGEVTDSAVVPVPPDALTEFGNGILGMERAKAVAAQLDDIIQELGLSVRIGQGQHLRVEAWCACASMVGVSPRTVWTKRMPETGPLEGYTARVEVVQLSNGQVIGAAEAGCFMDERMGGGPRWKDQHAVLSMAQTRATSKSIGQVLRWIPVLAGYSGTPAEEMPRDTPKDAPRNEGSNAPQAYQPPPQGSTPNPANEKQKKMLTAVSIKRAEELIEACIKADETLKYADKFALSGSIKKHAAEYCHVGNQLLAKDVDAVKAAIERATIGADGETTIPEEK